MFVMVAYDKLKDSYNEQVVALRGKWSAATVEGLPEHRRIQVQFLNAVMRSLDTSNKYNDIEKARIFSGFLLIVIDEIQKNQRRTRGSLFGPGLEAAVGITDENVLDPNSSARMVNVAMKFFTSSIFVDGDSTKPLLEKHIFSEIKKDDETPLDITLLWDRGIDIEATSRKKVLSVAKAALEKDKRDREEARKSKSPSFLSSLWGGSAKKQAVLEEEEEEKDSQEGYRAIP